MRSASGVGVALDFSALHRSMHFQSTQCNVVKGDLEGGGLMKALIDGEVHSAYLCGQSARC